jgi:hypothetical protein
VKVDGGNGKWYTRDHPHEIHSPHIMRFEEIRDWMREFLSNPAYGWTEYGGIAALERSLGMNKNSLKKKLTTAWIWPKEQVRLTSRIRDILDGRIVPRRISKNRMEGVYVDPPQPPNVPRKRSVKIAVQVGKLTMLPQDHRAPMRLPDFKKAFQDVPWWEGKGGR